jgi:S-adenosylmethionine synthetase
MTVAYSPLSNTEKIVLFIEKTLNDENFKKECPFIGTDIKIMAKRIKNKIDVTACIPFIAIHTPSKEFYYEKIRVLEEAIKKLILNKFSQYDISIKINTRDNSEKSDYYLTLTGSAIESGDEGVVGRGNRYNGVIPFTRHMSTEACCGKNPVYHVGKIYTAIGSIISNQIFEQLGLETYVYLTSQIGRNLSDPWSVCIDVCDTIITPNQRQIIEKIIEQNFNNTEETTMKIIEGKLNLY